ncbi:MAG TPA: MmcQ/YjbR family DNA-binding protein [Flavobacteriaceae bacterium]|nr:MmcQ/YjbR family DNA-binding protein [Flavobacteriaceae bacterium]MCB9214066.1 MmcQ/YjbR family DNA-binding protein [Alteromonas sp.]HPF11600.1 MmcQ/YjbR family DNA-binding protein [Flavobacteriaceae bacterium]HQU21818.1 MmcQ/YjbR family DNA-binding protein [Flavobacteriaceae bacterium]HQU65285.1 MmcQ/YjbR family DNA-binding protein [Flavobacteriaceae bacterium]
MHIEAFRNYCLAKKGVTECFPFDEQTLVFKVMGKMFALSGLEHLPSQVNLKCDPDRSVELRTTHDGVIIPGYHMSKLHWNTIFIEELPPQLIAELIDHSYNLVVAGLPKKLREELKTL